MTFFHLLFAQQPGVPIGLSDTDIWAGIVGILLPPVAALLQGLRTSPRVNAIIFAVACVIAATVTELVRLDGHWIWNNWLHTVLVVVAAGLATYHLYWKPSGHIDSARAVGSPKV